MQNPRQIYRLRARASGREAFAPAEPGGVYIDRETGEEMEPVTRLLPLAPSASALLRAPENTPEVTPATHRALAVDLFNRAWDLLEGPRSPADDRVMLATALASRLHWTGIGNDEEATVGKLCNRRRAAEPSRDDGVGRPLRKR